jgi:hypothetical protein
MVCTMTEASSWRAATAIRRREGGGARGWLRGQRGD